MCLAMRSIEVRAQSTVPVPVVITGRLALSISLLLQALMSRQTPITLFTRPQAPRQFAEAAELHYQQDANTQSHVVHQARLAAQAKRGPGRPRRIACELQVQGAQSTLSAAAAASSDQVMADAAADDPIDILSENANDCSAADDSSVAAPAPAPTPARDNTPAARKKRKEEALLSSANKRSYRMLPVDWEADTAKAIVDYRDQHKVSVLEAIARNANLFPAQMKSSAVIKRGQRLVAAYTEHYNSELKKLHQNRSSASDGALQPSDAATLQKNLHDSVDVSFRNARAHVWNCNGRRTAGTAAAEIAALC